MPGRVLGVGKHSREPRRQLPAPLELTFWLRDRKVTKTRKLQRDFEASSVLNGKGIGNLGYGGVILNTVIRGGVAGGKVLEETLK